jgi:uncharacterized protein YeaO (DUF488 family)
MLKVKWIYDPPARGDVKRVLVDRLWPRGSKAETAEIDEGSRTSLPAMRFGNGFSTLRSNGQLSGKNTRKNLKTRKRSLISSSKMQKKEM